MDTREPVETRSVAQQTQPTDSAVREQTVKLVEMGKVSTQTKGTNRGLELGLTPRY